VNRTLEIYYRNPSQSFYRPKGPKARDIMKRLANISDWEVDTPKSLSHDNTFAVQARANGARVVIYDSV